MNQALYAHMNNKRKKKKKKKLGTNNIHFCLAELGTIQRKNTVN
jgi:hypothetical protein